MLLAVMLTSGEAKASTYGQISTNGCKITYETMCDPAPFMVVSPADLPGALAGEIAGGTSGPNLKLVGRIFSSVVCQVETIIGELMGDMWCNISAEIAAPLAGLLVLYVVVFGAAIAIGMENLSGGEVGKRLVKVMLVWLFATQADYALGIMFQFYMWLIKDGIAIVLTNVSGTNISSAHILHNLDLLVSTIFYTNDFSGGGRVATFITGAITMAAMPGGAFLGSMIMGMAGMTLFVFARTILTYLLALIMVVFYLSMGPIFLSCALFKVTQRTFQNWLTSLAGFALQPVLIFAYLVMIEAYMTDFNDKIWPFIRSVVDQTGSQPLDTCQGPACITAYLNTVKVDPKCVDEPGPDGKCETYNLNWDFSQGYGDWTIFFKNIGITFILSYATITFLDMVPAIARTLASGGARMITLGGSYKDSRRFDGSSINARGFDNMFGANDTGGNNDSILGKTIQRIGPDIISSGDVSEETLSKLMSGLGEGISKEFAPARRNFNFWGTQN